MQSRNVCSSASPTSRCSSSEVCSKPGKAVLLVPHDGQRLHCACCIGYKSRLDYGALHESPPRIILRSESSAETEGVANPAAVFCDLSVAKNYVLLSGLAPDSASICVVPAKGQNPFSMQMRVQLQLGLCCQALRRSPRDWQSKVLPPKVGVWTFRGFRGTWAGTVKGGLCRGIGSILHLEFRIQSVGFGHQGKRQ